jgi:polyphenol oxidase
MAPDLPGAAAIDVRRGAVPVVELSAFGPLGADVVVTTRRGGVSSPPYDTLNLGDHVGDAPEAVNENRSRLAATMGVGVEDLLIARQVHGAGVAIVERGEEPGEADVLATTDERVAIAVLVADCVPLVVVDPVARVLVVAHAGWRGTAAGVARVAVATAVGLGAHLSRCRAALGPCISGATYQVGVEVADALTNAGCASAITPDADRFLADLAAANVAQLRDAGIVPAHVWAPSHVTDGGTTFFSDRAHRPCGRFALAAKLRTVGS